MDWYESEVRELEKAMAARVLPKDPVVFYGSSTVRLWDTLARDMGDERAVNLGFGGSTLEACVHFFERIVVPARPCSLVVYSGDNELGDGRSADDLLHLFRGLAAKVERSLGNIEFGFISIKPSVARYGIIDRMRNANRLIREDIQARKGGYFIDLFDAMLKPDGRPQENLFCEDGLHLSRAGYELWTKLLSSFRHRMFTRDCSSLKVDELGLKDSESRVSPVVQPEP